MLAEPVGQRTVTPGRKAAVVPDFSHRDSDSPSGRVPSR